MRKPYAQPEHRICGLQSGRAAAAGTGVGECASAGAAPRQDLSQPAPAPKLLRLTPHTAWPRTRWEMSWDQRRPGMAPRMLRVISVTAVDQLVKSTERGHKRRRSRSRLSGAVLAKGALSRKDGRIDPRRLCRDGWEIWVEWGRGRPKPRRALALRDTLPPSTLRSASPPHTTCEDRWAAGQGETADGRP